MSEVQNELPKVVDEQILICEKCHKELGFVLYLEKTKDLCPTCHNQAEPNSCWLLCATCRGLSN